MCSEPDVVVVLKAQSERYMLRPQVGGRAGRAGSVSRPGINENNLASTFFIILSIHGMFKLKVFKTVFFNSEMRMRMNEKVNNISGSRLAA